jgi:hypothetical protein
MDDFVHALRVRELVFGGEMEGVWVGGGCDGEVGPGHEGRRHLVLSIAVDIWWRCRWKGGRKREERWERESI